MQHGTLATIHRHLGNHAEAVSFNTRALAIKTAALGEMHPEVARTLGNLAILHGDAGNHVTSLELYAKAVCVLTECLGEQHCDTALMLDKMASTHRRLGQLSEAAALYGRAGTSYAASLGQLHPEVGRGRHAYIHSAGHASDPPPPGAEHQSMPTFSPFCTLVT